MLSAAVLVPVALVCVWLGGPWFLALLVVATAGITVEWLQMARNLASPAIGGANLRPLLVARCARGIGLAYILAAAAALAWLRADPAVGRANVLFLLIVVWSTDIVAYLVGRAIGGRRLAPHISPGKTVSGAIGGLAGACLVGIAASFAATATPAPLGRAAAVAGLLGLVAQAGDLLESYAKRRCGVKDSGRLIPGHGGLLDRLDALLAAAIVAAVLALAGGRGVVLWG